MTTPRYSQPPPPLPPPPPPTNRQYHVHYISPTHSAPNANYYSPSPNYNPSTDRRRSSSAHGGIHSPKDHKHHYEPYPVHQRRRSLSPRPTNSTSPPSSESQSPDTGSQKNNGDQKKTTQSAKRAAQNRAAQRAFRQRRERYVKDLEIRVKEMDAMQEEMNKLVEQNMAYRRQVDSLTRELKSAKNNAGGGIGPYMNGHKAGMPKASSPPPEAKLESPRRYSTIPSREGTFEAEMARRLSHSDHAKTQELTGPSESLYSLQQRRSMHAATRKPSSRSDSHQLPTPNSNSGTVMDHKNMNAYSHQQNGGSIMNTAVDRSKESPHSKSVPSNGNMYVPAPVMENGYPPRTEASMLPQPPAYSNMPRFMPQFNEMDQANSELMGMMDMPPLSMGEGEFEMEDPFAAEDGAEELDFAPEDCDRILDDLVTILQQRNRPQIPHNLNSSEAS
ncbi:hypothetical protein INT43_006054 [Umbelopsis isabellina]|uniref:BZIP domain-containing protein n=1 Tax=Mortierella isabellina TaxID=91625 RepID=A0A8H7PJ99_MORIS|nr:hypothetical protein INT43_006054 [Umbelopsis isabellina]